MNETHDPSRQYTPPSSAELHGKQTRNGEAVGKSAMPEINSTEPLRPKKAVTSEPPSPREWKEGYEWTKDYEKVKAYADLPKYPGQHEPDFSTISGQAKHLAQDNLALKEEIKRLKASQNLLVDYLQVEKNTVSKLERALDYVEKMASDLQFEVFKLNRARELKRGQQ